jgi:hypothetical protein
MSLNKYDYIIPIGSNCRIGMALRDLGLRKKAFPLDWTLTTSKSVYECFLDNFNNFLNINSCREQNLKHIIDFKHIINFQYNVNITHEPSLNTETIKKYKRKVDNLHSVLEQSNRILLIRNMLDCQILDVIHSDITRQEEKQGRKHYDLEWIYKTKDLLSEKYENLQVDLLIIYYDESNVLRKRKDVIYKTSSIRRVGKEWDRFACQDVLRRMM